MCFQFGLLLHLIFTLYPHTSLLLPKEWKCHKMLHTLIFPHSLPLIIIISTYWRLILFNSIAIILFITRNVNLNLCKHIPYWMELIHVESKVKYDWSGIHGSRWKKRYESYNKFTFTNYYINIPIWWWKWMYKKKIYNDEKVKIKKNWKEIHLGENDYRNIEKKINNFHF